LGHGLKSLNYGIIIEWGASSGVVDSYRIYYGSILGGPYPNLLVEVGSTTTDCYATLDEGLTYYLVVRAYNIYGESGNSNEVKWPKDGVDSEPPNTSGYVPAKNATDVPPNTNMLFMLQMKGTELTNLPLL